MLNALAIRRSKSFSAWSESFSCRILVVLHNVFISPGENLTQERFLALPRKTSILSSFLVTRRTRMPSWGLNSPPRPLTMSRAMSSPISQNRLSGDFVVVGNDDSTWLASSATISIILTSLRGRRYDFFTFSILTDRYLSRRQAPLCLFYISLPNFQLSSRPWHLFLSRFILPDDGWMGKWTQRDSPGHHSR